MKITALLFTLAAASRTDGVRGYDASIIHDDNIRADGQYGSHRNQTTRYPTPAPTNEQDAFNNMHDGTYNSTGNTTAIGEQTDVDDMPTFAPTSFPTKTEEAHIGGDDENKHYAAKCTATIQSASN